MGMTSNASRPDGTVHFRPRRETVLIAVLTSGMCLDMMIERMLDRMTEDRS